MPRMKKDDKMTQQVLFEQLNKLEEKEKEGQEPATELMKVIAEKVPSKKKILKDFASEEARMILPRLRRNKNENEKMETGVDMGKDGWGRREGARVATERYNPRSQKNRKRNGDWK